ncbi:hypothetical protein [Levilactobacillus zymae]|uniref:hypothetical protein n=1 Tax=Levilactobacillus zymae TaxID=267363 RepID=UPI0028B8C1DF|nr:hypothetical protein [Levilactobacillus zymae]MDT6980346.1 hypothetical protein [Levilactobacillus zymae]
MFQDIAPHRLDNQFHGPRTPRPDDFVVVYHDQHVLLDQAQTLPRWTAVTQTWAVTPAQATYLLTIDQTAIFLVTAPVPVRSGRGVTAVDAPVVGLCRGDGGSTGLVVRHPSVLQSLWSRVRARHR